MRNFLGKRGGWVGERFGILGYVVINRHGSLIEESQYFAQ